MSDVIQVAELRAFVERIERDEEFIRERNADKSETYKELKARGYDVKAVKKIVAARRMDTHVREEQNMVFDLYWEALHGGSHVHARAHIENIEQFPHSSVDPQAPAHTADDKGRSAEEFADRPTEQGGGDD
ncbi:DUF2312 domain-containing protein [Brucella pituitosa]|uniref:DUF2312 domain-containing protein n=1 Tax=Brucella pituitosa TaxID=571256 RepID=UPI003F4AE41A